MSNKFSDKLSNTFSNTFKREQKGFTLIEVLISIGIFFVFFAIVISSVTGGLRLKEQEISQLDAQQNARVALQLLAQDLRSAAYFHVWQDQTGSCSELHVLCSDTIELSLLTSDGRRSAVAKLPATPFVNSTSTPVCDATSFDVGDVVTLYNDGTIDMLRVTGKLLQRDYSLPCQGPDGAVPNHDWLDHDVTDSGGGATSWGVETFVFGGEVVNYSLAPDPLGSSQKVLYRRTGFNAGEEGPQSGILAFDISSLIFSYGVKNPFTNMLEFYENLDDIITALNLAGGSYDKDPDVSATYIGPLVEAIRVDISSQNTDVKSADLQIYNFQETVFMRR